MGNYSFGCLLLFADAGVRAEVAVGRLSELFNRIERELNQWVKAAVESTLGHLGTVGALAAEDFWTKLKTALQEAGRPLVESNSELTSMPSVSHSRCVAGSLIGTSVRSPSESSVVPSEFGHGGGDPSVSSVSIPPSSSKPGKKSPKIT